MQFRSVFFYFFVPSSALASSFVTAALLSAVVTGSPPAALVENLFYSYAAQLLNCCRPKFRNVGRMTSAGLCVFHFLKFNRNWEGSGSE